MPWAAYVIGAALALLAVPVIGEFAALLFVIGGVLVATPFLKVAHGFKFADTTQLAVGLGIVATLVAATAAYLARGYMRAETAQQEANRLNGLILVLGIPTIVALSFWRLGDLWGMR